MENSNESKSIEIIQSNDKQKTENESLSKSKEQEKYTKVGELTDGEVEANETDLELNVNANQNNNNELTAQEIEHLNKIKEEVMQRSQRYSERFNKTSEKNKSNILNEISYNDASNIDMFESTEEDLRNMKEINPNENRIFNEIQPYFFIKEEPLFVLGPSIQYYIWIFSSSSFLSVIFYSLKKEKNSIMQLLFWFGYLFYGVTYSLLMLLNPGIPKNKKDIDIIELRKNYIQCEICKCIYNKNSGYLTFHCNDCNICVENFDHHCTFASKCIGNNNKFIFKLWTISIPLFIIIIFFYLIL